MKKQHPNKTRALPGMLQSWAGLKDRDHSGQQRCKWPERGQCDKAGSFLPRLGKWDLQAFALKTIISKKKIWSCYQFPLNMFGTLMFPN